MTTDPATGLRPLIIACGALVGDLRAVLHANALTDSIEVCYLPANLHNDPQRIVPAVRARLDDARRGGRAAFVAYADCGTGGRLDAMLEDFADVRRLPGSHCYEFFAGHDTFARLHDEEIGTFYLTDFLAKHFDALVWSGLGLDRHPELRDQYFGRYTRVLHLTQSNDAVAIQAGRDAASRLGLRHEVLVTGRERFAAEIAFVPRGYQRVSP